MMRRRRRDSDLIICLTTPFREKKHVTERRKNGIDFGYLKDLDETDIVRLFREDRLDQLARQVKQLSSVTWLKQLCLKLSAVAAGVGLSTIVFAYLAGIALSD
jgi:hypothetical protein